MRVFAISIIVLAFVALANGQKQDAEQLCAKVKMIKELPHGRIESGRDAVFDEIVAAGEAVVPCLIDNITDIIIMNDPRCPHITDATTVGDVSYFVLVRIMDLRLEQFFPEKYKNAFKTEGVYAYHNYIDQKGARKELQQKVRKWYLDHKGNQS